MKVRGAPCLSQTLCPLSHGCSDNFSVLVKRLSPSWRPDWSAERNRIWTNEMVGMVSQSHPYLLCCCCCCVGCLCRRPYTRPLQWQAENTPVAPFPPDIFGCGVCLCFSVSNLEEKKLAMLSTPAIQLVKHITLNETTICNALKRFQGYSDI